MKKEMENVFTCKTVIQFVASRSFLFAHFHCPLKFQCIFNDDFSLSLFRSVSFSCSLDFAFATIWIIHGILKDFFEWTDRTRRSNPNATEKNWENSNGCEWINISSLWREITLLFVKWIYSVFFSLFLFFVLFRFLRKSA